MKASRLPVAGRAKSEFEVGDLEGTGHDRSVVLLTDRSYRLGQGRFK